MKELNMKPLLLNAPKQILMPVRPLTSAQIRSLCGVSKLREFDVAPTKRNSYVSKSKSYPYAGRFKNWAKRTNNAWITSFATVSANMVTIHHAGAPDIMRRSPAGMVFAINFHGIYLIRVSDGMDYHPGLSDWLAANFATQVRKGMSRNYNVRSAIKKTEKLAAKNKKEVARMETLFRRDLPTTRVTLLDSRNAGNCVEGSLVFAERRLSITRDEILSSGYLFSVSADRLLRAANGDTEAALRAARVAWSRETMVSI